MSNLVVMAFDNEYGAEQVRDKLVDLQKAQLIERTCPGASGRTLLDMFPSHREGETL